jgi:uncharacterized protein (TIGR02611 family)
MNAYVYKTIKHAKRIIIGVIGFTVLSIGIMMIFLPGPAVIVIPVGLTILATEFVWARRLLKKVKRQFSKNERQGGGGRG